MKITSSSTIGKQVEFLADHQFHALVQRGRETFNKKLVLYEFGVFTGNNALAMLIGYGCRRYFGFDSFVGLPEELDGIEIRDQWHKGNFNASETLGVPIENAIEHIRTKLANRNPKTDVVLIHEWYENLSKRGRHFTDFILAFDF